MIKNPNDGITNFDNFLSSFLMVFQIITLEGWTPIMIAIVKTTWFMMPIFFIAIIMIGAFFLINLTLAIITVKYKEAKTNDFIVEEKIEEQDPFDKYKSLDIYKSSQVNYYGYN